MATYNTNLAAEFYVLSVLHRLGADANLTLGNKKAVDIAVVHGPADSITIDVKGLAGKTSWPVDNVKAMQDRHFIILICFLDKIADPTAIPETYVVPSSDLTALTYNAPGGRKVIQLSKMRKKGEIYRDAWHLVTEPKREEQLTEKTKHWSEDRFWTDALEQLYRLQQEEQPQLTLDINAISQVAYNGDGPAYKLMDAMLSVQEHEGWDGFKGAPRVMLALLIRLAELSRERR
jgi:hypothetical protein